MSLRNKPEEKVRQNLINVMTNKLGFPSGLIVTEKKLSQLPYLNISNIKIPNRRIDILCYGKNIHPDFDLYPLLMIECKAVALTDKVIKQVVGYNYYVKSYFVAIANEQEIKIGWYDKKIQRYTFIDYLPSYKEIITALQKNLNV